MSDVYALYGWKATKEQFTRMVTDMDPQAASYGVTSVVTQDGTGYYIGKVLGFVSLLEKAVPVGIPVPAEIDLKALQGWMRVMQFPEFQDSAPKIWLVKG